MASWADTARGVTDGTRAEREHRRTYLEILDHLPAGGLVEHRRADGSHLTIYIQPTPENSDTE